MGICGYGDTEPWGYGDIGILAYGYMGIGDMGIWGYGDMGALGMWGLCELAFQFFHHRELFCKGFFQAADALFHDL